MVSRGKLNLISILISGILETPSDFSYRSPRALVTAKDPETLPLIMKPPYFLYI